MIIHNTRALKPGQQFSIYCDNRNTTSHAWHGAHLNFRIFMTFPDLSRGAEGRRGRRRGKLLGEVEKEEEEETEE